ncbi:hypothetical protein B0H13DRAFT_1963705 [Mycena leptocephala]|nr:hypothetical protein B0H13DRAFT_1963705 [Mycena leptocephala]
MPPRAKPFDLKNVAKLFNDTIAAIRDDTPDFKALEPQAIEWLKAARYKLMRDLEQEYYKLERARDTPMSQPAWALDPAQAIFLQPVPLPTVLNAYRPAIRENLLTLLKDCGFNHCSSPALDPSWMFFQIHFPAQVAAAPPPPQQPPPLYVKDEFSRLAKGGAVKSRPGVGGFSGSNFARLLTDARGENGNGAGDSPDDDDTAAGPSKKRRRASRIVKEESDDEARPRLRSVTRASSAATLRESNSVNTRRSGRKRVKREE